MNDKVKELVAVLDKIAEIRELAEMAIEQNRAKAFIELYIPNLCDALEVATTFVQNAIDFSRDYAGHALEAKAKIDQILEEGQVK